MFEITIHADADLNADDSAQVEDMSRIAFGPPLIGPPEPPDLLGIEWAGSQWNVIGRWNGRIVSVVGLLTREVAVGPQRQGVWVGGVGGVCTHPDFQRRGFSGQLLERAADYMRADLRVPFGLLVCGPHREHFYASHGWRTVTAPMMFDLRGAKQTFPDLTMILPLTKQPWPEGVVDLCGKPW